MEGQSFQRASEHGWNRGAASNRPGHCHTAGHLCSQADHKEMGAKFQPQRVQHSGCFLAVATRVLAEGSRRCLLPTESRLRSEREAETGKNKLSCNHHSTNIKPSKKK